MRPLKLTMSAFGSYSGITEIDFEKLGKSGIYLITGDTGSGKTTIFEAIVFALYGETVSKERDSSMFRSKYAGQSDKTFVTLEFENKGRRYKITRSPSYMKPKRDGSGFRKETAATELILPDNNIITGNREAESKIIEILGIDRAQFTQTAMIAQGDFRKLLLSSTKERKEIFRRIFKTEKFEELQNRLKEEKIRDENACRGVNSSIKQYISGIICEDGGAYSDEIQKARLGELPVAEVSAILNAMNTADFETMQKLDFEIEALDKRLAELNALLGRLEEYKKAEKALETLKEKSKAENNLLVETAARLEEAQKAYPETEALNSSAGRLKAELEKYGELESLCKKLSETKRKIKAEKSEAEQTRKQLEHNINSLNELKKELRTLDGSAQSKLKLEHELENISGQKASLKKLSLMLEQYQSALKALTLAQNEFELALSKKDCAEQKYNNLNSAYLREQAGVLAAGLRDNAPCPVCGSTIHPDPAEISDTAPDEKQLKSAKAAADKAQSEAAEKASVCSRQKGKLEALRESINTKLDEFSIASTPDLGAEAVNEKINSLQIREDELTQLIKAEQRKLERKQILDREIPKTEENTETLKQKAAEIEASISSCNVLSRELENRVASLKGVLEFDSKASAENQIKSIENKIKSLSLTLEKCRENHARQKEVVQKLDGQTEQLIQQLKNAEKLDGEGLQAERKSVNAVKQKLREQRDKISNRFSSNQKTLESISEKLRDAERLENRYRLTKSLSDTANGAITGKTKITLEAYIQMTYFDRILARANTRLMVMSGGQYEMKRRDTSEGKINVGGLEIDVIDHYNSSTRAVNTLSGGESFKASLSLALGLSDEVQSNSGGIRLDTMFVDEGFGTLDEDSLKNALGALSTLSRDTRLVGIISHVNELKEKIDRQIVITKDRDGASHAKVIAE